MHHCLTKAELQDVLALKVDNIAISTEALRIWVGLADNWQDELGALTYLLSQILERRAKDGYDCETLIRMFYALPDAMWLDIQEFDSRFIKYMLVNLRDRSKSLEDELVELQNRFRDHNYERTLHRRYK